MNYPYDEKNKLYDLSEHSHVSGGDITLFEPAWMDFQYSWDWQIEVWKKVNEALKADYPQNMGDWKPENEYYDAIANNSPETGFYIICNAIAFLTDSHVKQS